MVEAKGIVKSFGRREVLKGVDLVVREGEFVIVMGPNGAGKTTLLRIIATIVRPDKGQLKVCGFPIPDRAPEARAKIGFLTHSPLLYDELTARENLLFYASLLSVRSPEKRIAELLQLVGLEDRAEERVRTFSRGMLQRLAIARAILHSPPLLLLDEPFTGLDQKAAEVLTAFLKRLPQEGHAVIMTTHQLDETLTLAHRILVLNRGKFVAEIPREELRLDAFRKQYAELTSR